jgi:pimeloyl-ACP methyl ester carboxylesterase
MPGSSTNKRNRQGRIASGQSGPAPASGPDGWFEDALRAATDLGLTFSGPHQQAPPDNRIADVNGIRLRYLDWGYADKPDLLFVHGFAQQAHSWDFAALAVRDLFHVTAIDLRGHGESDRSPDEAYSFDIMYSDLDAFIMAADLKSPVLCGLSMGGTLSYTDASRRPASVRALVITESAPEPPQGSRNRGRESIPRFTAGSGEFSSLEELGEKVRSFASWRSASQVRSGLNHSVSQKSNGNWTWKYDPAIRDMTGSFASVTDRWDALACIIAPTLLGRGEDSDHTDAETFAQMKETIPGSQLVSIERAGHRVSGDNPHVYNAALRDFLLNHALQAEGH